MIKFIEDIINSFLDFICDRDNAEASLSIYFILAPLILISWLIIAFIHIIKNNEENQNLEEKH